jgi:hypothetical protein
MKKIAIAVLATLSLAASAAEVTVSGVTDYAGTDKSGVRIGTSYQGIGLSVTHIDDRYNRYAVGKQFEIAKLGQVAFSAGGSLVYQDTLGAIDKTNGYGITIGGKATLPLTKAVDITASVERFYGQDRINRYDGNVGSVGLTVKF